MYLDALGAQRIPDPTTAGDFCRRFGKWDIESLMSAINETRLRVWKKQPDRFFDEATIDADGTLAQTQEPLYLVNRSGNRPSHEGAARRLDQAIHLCRRAGFRRVTLSRDTD